MIKNLLPFNGAARSLAPIAAGGVALLGLYLASLYSYLLFHTLAGLFSLIVSGALFLLVWNTRHRIDNTCCLSVSAPSLWPRSI